MNLSQHFSDHELGVDGADENVRQNAVYLCEMILEPIRAILGVPLIINDGYRPPSHNLLVGGVSNSEHLYQGGHAAADFRLDNYPLTKAFQQIRDSGLPFRQVILESGKEGFAECIHISTCRDGLNKHEALIGHTHGIGEYSAVSCAPVKFPQTDIGDNDGANSGADG